MSEVRDPAIKLFGKTITLPMDEGVSNSDQASALVTTSQDDQITSEGELSQTKHKDDFANSTADDSTEPEASSAVSDDSKTQHTDKETFSPKSTNKDDINEASVNQEVKTLKKPDKILPCPRCNSMETKFCYYNNYNVNQPRHFCKKCQRYWTAGGTMRNVPVGSGRRKHKSSSASCYRHIMVSDALQAAHGMNLPTFKANGPLLSFGSDKPLCDSMNSVLNLAGKSQNGFDGSERRIPAEFGNDQLSGSCSKASNSTEKGNSSPPQVPHFPGPPWPCSWNAALSSFPVSFYPTPPYWGCSVASPWMLPWVSQLPSSLDCSIVPTSPTSFGKHSRVESMLDQSNSGKEDRLQENNGGRCVLIPKTLRIDDLDEAAKSSMWSTLGIKNDNNDPASSARHFKAFNSKIDDRNREADTSLVLQANPAALSRSLNFHESM